MRIRIVGALMVLASVGTIYGATTHRITLSPYIVGQELGLKLAGLVGLFGLMALIFGGSDAADKK